MSQSLQYASFLLRIWRQGHSDAPAGETVWQSELEHIQTGDRWTFETPDELLMFLRHQTEETDILRAQNTP